MGRWPMRPRARAVLSQTAGSPSITSTDNACGRATGSAAAGGGLNGSSSEKQLPFPGNALAVSDPPWARRVP